MIVKTEMMGVLIASSPEFASTWRQFVCEWQGSAELPLYVALGQFARHLIELHTQGDTERLTQAFRSIEHLLCDGDDYVREAATIGILETLQNLASHGHTRAKEYEPFLGEVSRRQWDALNRFWGTKKFLWEQ